MNHNFDDALAAQQNKPMLRRGPCLDSCPSFGRTAPRRPPNFASPLGTVYPRMEPKAGPPSTSVPQLPYMRSPSGSPVPSRPPSIAEKRLPSTRAPSPYAAMNWSQSKTKAGDGIVRFHVPAADYRKHLRHELKPMGMGDGQYMENRKLNKRHDRLAGDYRGQASGAGAMKQEMCPGHGTIWTLGDDGLWRYTKDENEKTWTLPASKPHHVAEGDYRHHVATEKKINAQSSPSSESKSHVVREGDYRSHVGYDTKHAAREDSSSHVVKEGDYREHIDYDKKHGGGHVAV